MEKACQKAMEQIKDQRYEEFLRNDGRNEILAYGIAFCRNACKVINEKDVNKDLIKCNSKNQISINRTIRAHEK